MAGKAGGRPFVAAVSIGWRQWPCAGWEIRARIYIATADVAATHDRSAGPFAHRHRTQYDVVRRCRRRGRRRWTEDRRQRRKLLTNNDRKTVKKNKNSLSHNVHRYNIIYKKNLINRNNIIYLATGVGIGKSYYLEISKIIISIRRNVSIKKIQITFRYIYVGLIAGISIFPAGKIVFHS